MDEEDVDQNFTDESIVPFVQENIPLVDNNGNFVDTKSGGNKYRKTELSKSRYTLPNTIDTTEYSERDYNPDISKEENDSEEFSGEDFVSSNKQKKKNSEYQRSKRSKKNRAQENVPKKQEKDEKHITKEPFKVSISQTNYFKMFPMEHSPLDDQDNFKPSLLEKYTSNNSHSRGKIPEMVSNIVGHGLPGCSAFADDLSISVNEYLNSKKGSYYRKKLSGYGGNSIKIHPFPGCCQNLDNFFDSYVLENTEDLPFFAEHFDIETVGDCYAAIPLYDESDPYIKMCGEILKIVKSSLLTSSKKFLLSYDKLKPVFDRFSEMNMLNFYNSVFTSEMHVSNIHKFHKDAENATLKELMISKNFGLYSLLRSRSDYPSSLTFLSVSDSCETLSSPMTISSITKQSTKNKKEEIKNIKPTLFDYESITDFETKLKSKLKSTCGTTTSLEKTSTWIYYKPKFSYMGTTDINGSINYETIGDLWTKLNENVGRICSFSEFFDNDKIRKIISTKRLVTLVIAKKIRHNFMMYAIDSIISEIIGGLSTVSQNAYDPNDNKIDTNFLDFLDLLGKLKNICREFFVSVANSELSFFTEDLENEGQNQSSKHPLDNKSTPENRRFFKFLKSGKLSNTVDLKTFLLPNSNSYLSSQDTNYQKSFGFFGEWEKKKSNDLDWHEKLYENENIILKDTHGFIKINKPKLKTPIFPDTFFNTLDISISDDNANDGNTIGFYWYGLQMIDNIWDIGVIKSSYLRSEWIFTQCIDEKLTLCDAFFPLSLPKRFNHKSFVLYLLSLKNRNMDTTSLSTPLTDLSHGIIRKQSLNIDYNHSPTSTSDTTTTLETNILIDGRYKNKFDTCPSVLFYYSKPNSKNDNEENLEFDDCILENETNISAQLPSMKDHAESLCICNSEKLITEASPKYLNGYQVPVMDTMIFYASVSVEPDIYPESYLDRDTKKVQIMFKQKNKYAVFFVKNVLTSLV